MSASLRPRAANTTVSITREHMSVFVNRASAWVLTNIPAYVSGSSAVIAHLSSVCHLSKICGLPLALYGRELEEDEEEEEEEEDEQLDFHRLPDLLFRSPPQLLQYTAALHSRYGSDDNGRDDGDAEDNLEVQRERRGELRLESHIGT